MGLINKMAKKIGLEKRRYYTLMARRDDYFAVKALAAQQNMNIVDLIHKLLDVYVGCTMKNHEKVIADLLKKQDALVDALNLKQTSNFTIKGMFSNTIPIGRFCESPSSMNHSGFANYIVSKLESSSVNFTGNLDEDLQQIMVCAGDVISTDMLLRIAKENAKTIITGEVLPRVRTRAHELGMNIYEIGSSVAATPGMKRLRHQLSLEYPEMKIEFADTEAITQSLRPYSKDMA